MNFWNPVRYKQNIISDRLGEGINTFLPFFSVNNNEATDLRNVSSRNYPSLSVRPGKQPFATALTTPNALGQRNNQYIHVVDGTVWKYWDGSAYVNVKTGLTAGKEGSFEEFATGTTRYLVYSNGTERLSWDGTTVVDLTNAPLSKIFTTHQGRIYWARDNDIVFSALNDINDYSTINDAGSIDITKAKGSLTSMYEYNNRVICFTEFSMHELYGTGPVNYELVDIEGSIGCISDKSVITCNKGLYFVWWDGVYEFYGSSPIKVSEPWGQNGVTGGVTTFINGINKTYKDIIASGSIGDYLYISIPYGSSTTNNITLEFNTKLRKWYVRSDGFKYFVTIGNTLYGCDNSGVLWDMVNGTSDNATAIAWYYTTKVFTDNSISRQKTLSNLWVVYELPVGSTLDVYISDSAKANDFELLTSLPVNSGEPSNSKIILPATKLQNVDWYRLKFVGTGPCTIHYIEKMIRVKVR